MIPNVRQQLSKTARTGRPPGRAARLYRDRLARNRRHTKGFEPVVVADARRSTRLRARRRALGGASVTDRWLPVVGYEGFYEVSSDGRVRSLKRRFRILKQAVHPRGGYRQVTLAKNGHHRTHKVHRLVLEAFVGRCPPGFVGCHNDGDTSNNRADNLRWDSPSANNFDLVRHGTHANANKTHCPAGHPYDDENTLRLRHAPKARRCRICYERQQAEHAERKRIGRRKLKAAS
ncbi:hypothetical protein CQY23_03060 [Mycobacterium celatum]|uniref:HNH nuclease domain-containing protein n=1 Tax=Mycobacterium celatum TaxID=28045 RepID=A0A2G5PR42_MYCCE|nr:hypothetical protein CQY23_03060 [Mycobacterium celatum]